LKASEDKGKPLSESESSLYDASSWLAIGSKTQDKFFNYDPATLDMLQVIHRRPSFLGIQECVFHQSAGSFCLSLPKVVFFMHFFRTSTGML
jgi:hypothetical protein